LWINSFRFRLPVAHEINVHARRKTALPIPTHSGKF
jgi:hypothetical protein